MTIVSICGRETLHYRTASFSRAPSARMRNAQRMAMSRRTTFADSSHQGWYSQRHQYKTSKHTFVETIGSVFYGHHHFLSGLFECLAPMVERNSLATIQRIKGVIRNPDEEFHSCCTLGYRKMDVTFSDREAIRRIWYQGRNRPRLVTHRSFACGAD